MKTKTFRVVLLLFAAVLGGIVVAIAATTSRSNLILAGVVSAGGMILAYVTSSPRVPYTAPAILAVLYVCGYVGGLISLLLGEDAQRLRAIDTDFLQAGLDDAQLFRVVGVIAAGVAGLTLGSLLLHLRKGHGWTDLVRRNAGGRRPESRVTVFGVNEWTWFLGSLVLVGLMWQLGIGRGVFVDGTRLPFGLGGFLVYARNMLVPALGYYFYQRFTETSRSGALIAAQLMLVGLLGSLQSLSRAYLVWCVGPLIVASLAWHSGAAAERRRVLRFALVSAFAVAVSVGAVNYLRDMGRSGGMIVQSVGGQDAVLSVASVGDMMLFVVRRVTGVWELLHVVAAGQSGFEALPLFWGEPEYGANLSLSLLRLSSEARTGNIAGYAYSLWGMWFLGGRYVAVFLASLISLVGLTVIEEAFLRLRAPFVGTSLVFGMSFWLWGGAQWFYVWRALVLVGLTAAAVAWFDALHTQRMPRALRVIGTEPSRRSRAFS